MEKKFFCGIFVIFCVQIIRVQLSDSAGDAMKFIDEVLEKLPTIKSENVVLVVGYTGNGKSALVHYLTGDNSKLTAIKAGIYFTIQDGLDPEKDRNISATESRTLIPEVVNDENQTVWIDCPGFGDTRNSTIEIAIAFSIKHVIESATNVKFVLVVNYDWVSDSGNRDGFDKLLARVTEMIKNVTQIENSVSLVVTRVPFFADSEEVTEEIFKNSTAKFVRDYRSTIERNKQNTEKIKLIDAIFEHFEFDDYSKISAFRRPNKTGPLDKNNGMMESRELILKSIMENSSYTKIGISDIGFPLSDGAKLEVVNIMKETSKNLFLFLNQTTDQLEKEVTNRWKIDNTFENHVRLIHVWEEMLKPMNQTNATQADRLVDQLRRLVLAFNVTSVNMDELNSTARHQKNLNVFQSLIKNGINHMPKKIEIESILKNITAFFGDLKMETQNKIVHEIKQMIKRLSTELPNIDQQVVNALQRKFESESIHSKKDLLENHCCRECNMLVTLGDWAERVKTIIHTFNITSINTNQLNVIKRNETHLNNLKWLCESEINFNSINIPTGAINYPCAMNDWYTFLIQEYGNLSDYEVQKDTNAYLIANLSIIMRKAEEYPRNSFQKNESDKVIDTTLRSPPQYHYNNESYVLTIKGNFAKSSDIQKHLDHNTYSSLETVELFIANTFFVDTNLTIGLSSKKTGQILRCFIHAPKWHILEKSQFVFISSDNYLQFFGWGSNIINADFLNPIALYPLSLADCGELNISDIMEI